MVGLMKKPFLNALAVSLLFFSSALVPARGQEAAATPVDGSWPRDLATSAGTFTVYQPQISAWDGNRTDFYAALAVTEKPEDAPVFGVAWFSAQTLVNKEDRLVIFDHVTVNKAAFPSAPEKESAWLAVLQKDSAEVTRTIALDRFEALLEVLEADKNVRALPLKSDPPRIVFSTKPAILAYVDGAPVYQPVKNTKLERVINTRVLMLREQSGKHYLRVFDGWLEAPALGGPWTLAKMTSNDLKKALEDAKASGQVDLLPGGNPEDKKTLPSLKSTVPVIYVATAPTELIVTEGEPNYVPIEGTNLVYAKNTTGNTFKYLGDQKTYVLVSGRWFRSASMDGPWENVPNDALPEDFAKIPDDSPKENVKASVAGTPQAKEALITNAIPQTAEVKVAETKMDPPKFDGDPKLAPLEGTELQYVVNTATPIVMVSPTSYYAVQNGIWFAAPAVAGPWVVATSVPTVIYSIPPSAPLHYVTYVRIYSVTPTVVTVGYTPGYYGTCVYHSTVVYGTGYYYPPYVGTVWYGPPATYGSGVGISYTPWTGWTVGFGFGWSWGSVNVGWGWGAYPWWGPVGWGYYYPYPYYRPPYWGGAAWGPYGAAAWGPSGWAATSGNVYHRWGSTSAVTRQSAGYNAWTGNAWRGGAGMSYNSRTGTLAAGQRSAVGNVYTGDYAYGGRGAATNARTGTTVAGGRVTAGNAGTGNEVTAGRVGAVNPRTGQAGSAGYVRGEEGSVARVGDDVYATQDGNVYKHNSSGGWDQQQRSGSWTGVQDRSRTTTLDAQQRARTSGQARAQNYGNARSMSGGGGARRRR